ncbi:molybdenum cofactor cytidylyltransferase/nicotine blue oxidoreductase [Nocardioides aurantiacus]|uniref:Molybdenum cofactor cytidylyltransferase/nicotine blue oxidoreductase n=2 Tax=Nocardioides aurantiacus TaxID=86796 RepID=A0A3N2CYB3_9ACTN|nr:molybdenum cofactor cytidylyltransferase/nicotine blue oxidoreductase [Nocardioides aurantiacus]
MGRPKALVEGWLAHAVSSLAACDDVLVVLGAGAAEARGLVPDGVQVAVAEDWAEGMGASLRAGLWHLARSASTRCVVTLVDLPDVDARVVDRLLERTEDPSLLARAAYDGTPGHPVLLGRDHWAGVAEAAVGDQGAKAYLRTHEVVLVECGDLATGRDQDTPDGASGPS